MTSADEQPKADLSRGVHVADLPDGGVISGQVNGEDAVLVRSGDDLFAVGAHCTHYHGPLADGLVVGGTIRCPWHHACFNLRTGEALRAPALDAIPCWRVERQGDTAYVREKIEDIRARAVSGAPLSVVIIGGGAAGLAAADMLRREGYDGPITMLSADEAPPPDRPNLSKDYLAGTAQEDWIPLRPPEFYEEKRIDLVLGARVTAIDVQARTVSVEGQEPRRYDALLIATGADPVRLPVPGAADGQVHYLRSFADSRAIIAAAEGARRAVVMGASFIGLEVAASLRTRGLAVDVVAPDAQPLERVLGPEVGRHVRALHESHGVTFHLGQTVSRVDGRRVTLSGGDVLEADVLVAGVGVRPAIALAEAAGLTIDRGIAVNEFLQTNVPGVYAAGDVARWPDPRTGDRIRVEHWVVAQRQGQAAARNMLGRREPFDAVPFFWSQHYDVAINYVGHAETWDAAQIDGSLADNDCTVTYTRGGTTLAVVTIFRDRESLEAERRMEREPERP